MGAWGSIEQKELFRFTLWCYYYKSKYSKYPNLHYQYSLISYFDPPIIICKRW
jgi:hypothetical protein